MSKDKFNDFLKSNSDKAPSKPGSEYAQILNKIEESNKTWKTNLSLWFTAAVACAFVGLVSIKSLNTGKATGAITSAKELAALESYLEAEFYGVSLEEDEEIF